MRGSMRPAGNFSSGRNFVCSSGHTRLKFIAVISGCRGFEKGYRSFTVKGQDLCDIVDAHQFEQLFPGVRIDQIDVC